MMLSENPDRKSDDTAPPEPPVPAEQPKRPSLLRRLKERLKELEKEDPNNYTLF